MIVDADIERLWREHQNGVTRDRRKLLRAQGLCVNGAKHGPARPGAGGRCEVCWLKRKVGKR